MCTELPTDEVRRPAYSPPSPSFLRPTGAGARPEGRTVSPKLLPLETTGCSHQSQAREPVRVLLVTAGGSRRSLLRACIDRQAPACQIEVVDSCFDAMARAARKSAHLMVLDLALDHVLIPALKQFLSRSAPHVTLHIFDDSKDVAAQPGRCAPSVERLQADLQAFIDRGLPQSASHH